MSYLLNTAYLVLLLTVSPWLLYTAVRTGKYRQGLAAKLWGRVPRRWGDRPCVWLHAVSVGEVNLLSPLLSRIEREHPDWDCVISTTTRSGFELAKRRYAPRQIFYCPLDFSWAVRRAMRRIRPDLLVLVELELWPNLIRAARQYGANVAVVNGRLSAKSFRGYRRIRPLIAAMLTSIDCICVQNEEYAERFRQLGAPPHAVHVTGSLKFDGAQTDRGNSATCELAALAGISARDVVFLAGSTQHPEESLALDAYRELVDQHPQLRLILVPRHAERFDQVAEMLDRSGIQWQRRSRLDLEGADPRARVLLVDAIGELAAWWGTAQIAFVGGSMGHRGGQNMIEPAAYGAAVAFGPQTHNFRDVVALMLERRAAVVVHNAYDITAFVRQCLENQAYAAELGERARQLIGGQLGAVERTARQVFALVEQPRGRDFLNAA